MINSNELRLGNLVAYDGRIFEIRSLSVLGADMQRVGKVYIEIDYDNFQPIPITEEWLVKLGFKQSVSRWFLIEYNTNCQEACEIFNIFYNVESKRLSFCEESEEGMIYAKHKIKYIHQLQNIYFALTGEELITNGLDGLKKSDN